MNEFRERFHMNLDKNCHGSIYVQLFNGNRWKLIKKNQARSLHGL